MAMAPVFHLNEVEAMQFTRTDEAAEAAALIRHLTQTDVIVTLGARGTYVLGENGGRYIPAEAAQVVDAIGAGDAHIGALMGAMAEGVSLEQLYLQYAQQHDEEMPVAETTLDEKVAEENGVA
jgi:sugar/nucleoside kinase (ribokinase family)